MIQPDGLFEQLAGGVEELMVNSLHAQAIDRVADGLRVEAISDDGVVEAVSMPNAKGLVLGVQWHAERPHPAATPLSEAMFRAFGDACRARLAARGEAASSIRAA
jgi:putative glutamine amidotransferase